MRNFGVKVGLACLVALAGCGGPDQNRGKVEIVYWTGWTGHQFDIQQKLVDRFNAQHPKIHVRIVSQMGDSGYQKVRIAFAGNATPDLMSTVWADELASYAQRGVLTPLDGYLKQSGRDFDKEYVPSLRKTLRVDGQVYGMAVTSDTEFIVYNQAIFDQAHLTSPIQTTDQLRDAARACMQYRPDGGVERYGYNPEDLRLWAYVFGGGWIDPKTHQVTANNPANVRALAWMQSFSAFMDPRRVQSFKSAFGNDSSPNGPFFVGKIAMWQTGEWASRYLQRYAPKDLRVGYFAFPVPPGGRPDTTYVNGSVFVIPAACKHKAETWEFLNWLTQTKQVEEFCGQIGNVPPLIAADADPVFRNDPLMAFAVKLSQSKNGVGAPGVAFWPEYTSEIQRAQDAALLGGESPQKVLDDLQARMVLVQQETNEELGR